MSTTSIEETVTSYLNGNGLGSYARQAGPVIENLKARERDLSEKLITYATDQGADPDDVRSYLEQIGMSVSEFVLDDDDADEEADASDDIGIVARLDQIVARLDSLTTFARRNGYSG